MNGSKDSLPVALVGKYVELQDAYISVKEALKHAGLFHERDVDIKWVHSEEIEREGAHNFLKQVSGIVVPGGFGSRGVDGMIETAKYARENQIPYLGLCLGMQVMVVEYARNVLGLQKAHSAELSLIHI